MVQEASGWVPAVPHEAHQTRFTLLHLSSILMSKLYKSFTMTAVTVSPPLLLLLAQHWQMQPGDFKELLLSSWLALQIHAIRIHPIQIHRSECTMSFLCVEETGAQMISSAVRSVTSGTPAERAKNAFVSRTNWTIPYSNFYISSSLPCNIL